ncbi:MAG TPA: substrate-binding domain-containing protein, partial [Firmicutes bacterium]|nr:substrate-binding domain-containing protein [Bacillota bacterium]
AENVLRELRSCTRLMHDISGNVRGMISVGITNGRAGIMMKDIIAKFHERYPHVSISFRITNSDELRELLYTGKVDIALIASEEVTSDFSAEQLSKEEVVLICSSRHPLAHLAGWNEDGTRRQCSLEWFKDEVFGLEPRGTPIRTHADHLFANENFRPDTTIENCTASLLLQLTGDGICCTIFSERHIANNSELVGFGFEPRRYFSVSLACRKDYQPNAVERYFMDVTREFYGAAGQQQRA